jgi:hypothetical protein
VQPDIGRAEEATIPVGTMVTTANWEQYKDYMSDGLQAMFGGKYFWKVPPQAVVEVGPTVRIPLPPVYLEQTEKYASQVKLRQLDSGGFTVENYVGGIPFPKPTEPNKGIKVLYNLYYHYVPYLLHLGNSKSYETDHYGNESLLGANSVYWRLRHIGDVGYPLNDPQAGTRLRSPTTR